MRRYFVTGTDTDVGKTIVTAGLALALRRAGHEPTIVKPVQTGVRPEEEGDAQRAGRLAGVAHRELARYAKPADPWSAALAEGAEPPTAAELARAIEAIDGAVVVEGAGGLLAPLNANEPIAAIARESGLPVMLVVGLRLGCLNHTLLALASCRDLGLRVAGGVLVERWGPASEEYVSDVRRVLQGKLRILGILPFAPVEADAVEAGARLFEPLMNQK